MMLSAAILGAAIFANAANPLALGRTDTAKKPSRPSSATLPPVPVIVEAAARLNPLMVARTIDEADAIWHVLGVTFEWHVADRAHPPVPSGREDECSVLHVMITDDVNVVPAGNTALGWIMFTAPDAPEPVIHLSRASALSLIATLPHVRDMPLVMQNTLIARALGRALAHELGHYLLGPAHTPRGLMQGTRPAGDFFSFGRRGFDLTPEQLDTLARHVKMTPPA